VLLCAADEAASGHGHGHGRADGDGGHGHGHGHEHGHGLKGWLVKRKAKALAKQLAKRDAAAVRRISMQTLFSRFAQYLSEVGALRGADLGSAPRVSWSAGQLRAGRGAGGAAPEGDHGRDAGEHDLRLRYEPPASGHCDAFRFFGTALPEKIVGSSQALWKWPQYLQAHCGRARAINGRHGRGMCAEPTFERAIPAKAGDEVVRTLCRLGTSVAYDCTPYIHHTRHSVTCFGSSNECVNQTPHDTHSYALTCSSNECV
jgi:hypothetical protein